jgi:hypothetical protein
MEQRAVTGFFVKLKKVANKMLEMLKNANNGERASRTSVFEWHKAFKEEKQCNKPMNEKAVLQLSGKKRKLIKNVWSKGGVFKCSDVGVNDRDQ